MLVGAHGLFYELAALQTIHLLSLCSDSLGGTALGSANVGQLLATAKYAALLSNTSEMPKSQREM